MANEGLGWDLFRFLLVGYFLQDMNSRLTEVQEEKRELQARTGGTEGGGLCHDVFLAYLPVW